MMLDGKLLATTAAIRDYTRAFGYSLTEAISERTMATMRELRKTSSDHKKPVTRPKRYPPVSPAIFELPEG